jgi:hypothetical protein
VLEVNPPGYGVDNKGIDGTYRDTGSAMGTPVLIAKNILGQQLQFYSRLGQKANRFIIILLFAAELQYQKAFLIGGDRGLQNIELEVIVLNQSIYYRFIDKPVWES